MAFNEHAETTILLDAANTNMEAGLSVEGPGMQTPVVSL